MRILNPPMVNHVEDELGSQTVHEVFSLRVLHYEVYYVRALDCFQLLCQHILIPQSQSKHNRIHVNIILLTHQYKYPY